MDQAHLVFSPFGLLFPIHDAFGMSNTIMLHLYGADEAAQQRLNNINQKLRDLERQMEILEAEMTKANGFERMILEAP